MNINKKYDFKVKYDQFGSIVNDDFFDEGEIILIEAFEKIIISFLQKDKEEFSMIELGSNQAYYSLLFRSILKNKKVKNILLEPTANYMSRGMEHFQMNGYDGEFIAKSIGKDWVAHGSLFDTEQISVDELISQYDIKELDVLHSDIDGSEITMLEGSRQSLNDKIIDYLFVLTHGEDIHDKCIDIINEYDYSIILNIDEQLVGADRLLIVKRN